ncbi:hypothetical protein CSOJ01_04103 [Colletotrichum sojae]|uniref:Uncharacterized protein n=1 Tax=Colletotrichum sojae TaxID=2175907 RepID=A0A8H6JKP6_9PEZI|nr:hypothetical protein CSOJ01_04103 [Colletotrichum sojae]
MQKLDRTYVPPLFYGTLPHVIAWQVDSRKWERVKERDPVSKGGGWSARIMSRQAVMVRIQAGEAGLANESTGRLNLARAKAQKRCGDARAATEFPRLSAPVPRTQPGARVGIEAPQAMS